MLNGPHFCSIQVGQFVDEVERLIDLSSEYICFLYCMCTGLWVSVRVSDAME